MLHWTCNDNLDTFIDKNTRKKLFSRKGFLFHLNYDTNLIPNQLHFMLFNLLCY